MSTPWSLLDGGVGIVGWGGGGWKIFQILIGVGAGIVGEVGKFSKY